MVDALQRDELVHEAPAIVGRRTPSALEYAGLDADRPDVGKAGGGHELPPP